MSAYLTRDEVRALLKLKVDQAGGFRTYSRQVDISQAYLQNVAKGRTPPGPKISAALGLEKGERLYRKLEEK